MPGTARLIEDAKLCFQGHGTGAECKSFSCNDIHTIEQAWRSANNRVFKAKNFWREEQRKNEGLTRALLAIREMLMKAGVAEALVDRVIESEMKGYGEWEPPQK